MRRSRPALLWESDTISHGYRTRESVTPRSSSFQFAAQVSHLHCFDPRGNGMPNRRTAAIATPPQRCLREIVDEPQNGHASAPGRRGSPVLPCPSRSGSAGASMASAASRSDCSTSSRMPPIAFETCQSSRTVFSFRRKHAMPAASSAPRATIASETSRNRRTVTMVPERSRLPPGAEAGGIWSPRVATSECRTRCAAGVSCSRSSARCSSSSSSRPRKLVWSSCSVGCIATMLALLSVPVF